MSCNFQPLVALFGPQDEIAVFGTESIATFYQVPCTGTLRDEFACCALNALGSDPSYRLSYNDNSRIQSVIDAYAIADLMLAERLK